MRQNAKLTEGPVGKTLIYLTLPMIAGAFSIVAFNLADTLFVAQLGTTELAAMSFTFPVVFAIVCVALGLGVGAGSAIARAIGQGDRRRVKRLTTDSLLLGIVAVALLSTIGLFTIDETFSLLGATDELLPYIREYMAIWYVGMVFVVVPMVGNNAIRASGDTKYPSLVMMVAAGVNVVLDPILIFGLWGAPRLGLKGAALATVIGRALTLVVSLAILHFREGMLDFSLPRPRQLWASWKDVLYVGVAAAGTRVLGPLSLGVVTRIVARFGPAAVAAVGAGTRVEAFALLMLIALSSTLLPFVGQNVGAGRYDRVHKAQRYANLFAIFWGGLCFVVLLLTAPAIGRLFSGDAVVRDSIVLYLWIVPLGYGLQGVCILTSVCFHARNRPGAATLIEGLRLFGLYVPLAFLGAYVYGLTGVFVGMAISSLVAGAIALAWLARTCKSEEAACRVT